MTSPSDGSPAGSVSTETETTAQVDRQQLTGLMKQYWDIKEQNPDALLFFRVGDFYELFDDDARVGARELEITLTGRPEPNYPGGRVPMAGIPAKAYEGYVSRLLAKGYSVAIGEQVGQVGLGKGPVERQVTRILTPGTVLEMNFLPPRESNYLVTLARGGEVTAANGKQTLWGLAAVDASCGEFLVTQVTEDRLLTELGRLSPREILVAKKMIRHEVHGIPTEVADAPQAVADRYKLTSRPPMFFQLEPCRRRIMQHFGVTTLEGFGCADMPLSIQAAGAALEYLERTQGTSMPSFPGITTYSTEEFLVIDEVARRNLELVETSRDRTFQGSLLSCLDQTCTPMGSRALRSWLLKPLLSIDAISERQDAVEELVGEMSLRKGLTGILKQISDLERLSIRISSRTASPKDMQQIGWALTLMPELAGIVSGCRSTLLSGLRSVDATLVELGCRIAASVKEDAPREIVAGGIFQDGYNAELDDIRSLVGGGKDWLERFQATEQERTGIRSLKVSFNSTFGYYIEITNSNKHLAPDDYIRKQTLSNAERYITPELKEYEVKILNSEKNQSDLEYRLFLELRNELAPFGTALKALAEKLAAVDSLVSLAQVASQRKYVKPVVDDSLALEIEAGRHPVLEQVLPMGVYVPNDTSLYGASEETQMIVLTGPNMAGKSSLLRQVAQITILAQMGSFVPAKSCRVGVVDRIFTRIGAVDDLTQGQSTFLVEMSETTQCCVCATSRSLILLDEIGRGTSTYDGVAIAWSVSEYLAKVVRARTIFATHYHELNGLASFFPQVANFQVEVAELNGRVEFLHHLKPGGASRSFGIHVASMAGLPADVIERAHYLMSQMEKRSAAKAILDGPKLRNIPIDEVMQLSLFSN